MTTMAIDRFEDYLAGRVEPTTVRVYSHAVSSFLEWLGARTLTADRAQAYINGLHDLAPSTISVKAHAIENYFKYRKLELKLDTPKSAPNRRVEYLNAKQLRVLIDSLQTPLERALIIVLFDTAVRISELLNVERNDIDFDNRVITVRRKGGRIQEVNISQRALEALGDWLDQLAPDAKPFGHVTYQDAWRIITHAGKRAGIQLHPHMLRHSRAVQMLRSGAPLHIVQQHLGHLNIMTTANIYGMFTVSDLKEQIPAW